MVAMKCLAAAALLSVVSADREGFVPHSKYTFAEFERDFQRQYSPAERAARQQHFEENLMQVLANNADPHSTWTAGVNELTDRSTEELQRRRGHRPDMSKVPKDLADGSANMPPLSHMPRDVDWRKQGNVVTPVKNQGNCGSCWAFAATAVMESHLALNTQVLNELAVQQIVSCMPNPGGCGGTGGCGGANTESGFDFVKKYGMTDMWKYGYSAGFGESGKCAYNKTSMPAFMTVDGYKLLPLNNAPALQQAVATVGPIAISVDARTWHLYHSGVFSKCNQTNPEIDHAVILDGYGFDKATNSSYWLVRNSWSPIFGEQGYIRLLRHTEEDEPCGMDINPQAGMACKGDNKPVKICGVCGVTSFSSFPIGAKLGSPSFTPHAEMFMEKRTEEFV